MVLTVDGCGNCSSAAWRYLDSMLHREPGTDTRQCRSTHYYIRGPQARLDIAYAAAAKAASLKPLQAKAAINISALQAPECFCHLHAGLPPAIGKATAGGKTAKRQHDMWESWLERLAGMARQKKQYHAEWRQGGIELSRHPGPTYYAHGAGRCPIGRATAASATCTAAGAMEQSGRRGRPRQTWGMGCAAGDAGGDTKKMPPDRGSTRRAAT